MGNVREPAIEGHALEPLAHRRVVYQRGFGNEFESEAVPGALPRQNNPLRAPLGLYAELISGTSCMALRQTNRRTYTFRLRPSVSAGTVCPMSPNIWLTAPLPGAPTPLQSRWDAFEVPNAPLDFVTGMATLCANGDARLQTGMAIHIYRANRAMRDCAFANHDGELLILPQQGPIEIFTEFGILVVEPGEFALIPRACRFRVDLPGHGNARGYVCENYGSPFRLPELGPLGSTGLANPMDFQAPVAAFEDREGPFQLIQKISGNFWSTELDHSPLDVVAWRGSGVPFKFNMYDFVAMGSTSRDHPDPSIFTALTAPGDPVLGANADLLILSPRWIVGENTFKPAPFHRNAATEFSALICGAHESKSSGTQAGGAILHNSNLPHGPDVAVFEKALTSDNAPQKSTSLLFAFETRYPLQLTEFAMDAPELQSEYRNCWRGFQKRFPNS
jgi:homogentisate 1,2-dioxygenase